MIRLQAYNVVLLSDRILFKLGYALYRCSNWKKKQFYLAKANICFYTFKLKF
jgi:hypothetical protein